MAYGTIMYDLGDNIAMITLNRPEKLNAFTGQMMEELIDAFDRADADDNVRAVIVTGAGRGIRGVGRCRRRRRARRANASAVSPSVPGARAKGFSAVGSVKRSKGSSFFPKRALRASVALRPAASAIAVWADKQYWHSFSCPIAKARISR